MNQKTNTVIVGAAAVIGGIAIGSYVGRKVMEKVPKLEPVLIFTSGVLIGVGVTALVAPATIDKSTAASILASD